MKGDTSVLLGIKGLKLYGYSQGVQGTEKQKLSPWDLLEGHRSPAPLSWAWLAATRLIRKSVKYQDTHQLLRFHTHSQQKGLSYFLEPPPLPPEDLEPVAEKQVRIYPNNTRDVYLYTRLPVTRWVKLSLNFELLVRKVMKFLLGQRLFNNEHFLKNFNYSASKKQPRKLNKRKLMNEI